MRERETAVMITQPSLHCTVHRLQSAVGLSLLHTGDVTADDVEAGAALVGERGAGGGEGGVSVEEGGGGRDPPGVPPWHWSGALRRDLWPLARQTRLPRTRGEAW